MIDPEAGRSTGRSKDFFKKVPYFASLDSSAMKDASSASTCRGARVTRLRPPPAPPVLIGHASSHPPY
jgi:hypothetical protein